MKKVFPKKYLGQNFLINPRITERIVDSCDLKRTDIVLEIGPGQGVLTREIAPKVKKVIAIETDKQLFQDLKEEFAASNVTILHADFLKYSFSSLRKGIKVIGNLPYYIATPIIEKIILNRDICHSFYATVQLEMGARLTAKPNNKDYGAFTCFAQYFADIKMLFKIKNTAFKPVPKVQSCFLKFDLTKGSAAKAKDEKLLFQLIRQAFGQRRKTILNALAATIEKNKLTALLEELNLNPRLRAENLSLENYVDLTNLLVKK